ncbi:MAG TPA: hypothetical protein VGB84_00680 [Arachidicoccus sp.]
MCNSYEQTQRIIQSITQQLYPSIQYQFVLISRYSDFSNGLADSEFPEMLWSLVNELDGTFQSLYAYETKMVFPSVLKYFDKDATASRRRLPDIAELLQITNTKEVRLSILARELDMQLRTINDESEQTEILKNIARLFLFDFEEMKSQWNISVNDKLVNCTCFKPVARFPLEEYGGHIY